MTASSSTETERVDVGLAVDVAALRRFGRRVTGGAEQHAVGLGPRRFGQGAGQAEVGDGGAALLVEADVGGLDVAVDEAAAVRVVERARRFEADQHRLGHREPAAGVEHVAQAAAAEELQHEERALVVLAPVEDPHDVRVVQRGRGLGLGPEPAQERLVERERGLQDLDRDPATQRGVVGHVDVRGPPGADRGNAGGSALLRRDQFGRLSVHRPCTRVPRPPSADSWHETPSTRRQRLGRLERSMAIGCRSRSLGQVVLAGGPGRAGAGRRCGWCFSPRKLPFCWDRAAAPQPGRVPGRVALGDRRRRGRGLQRGGSVAGPRSPPSVAAVAVMVLLGRAGSAFPTVEWRAR